MKWPVFILTAIILIITVSYMDENPKEQISFGKNVKQVIFFSDVKNLSLEAPYYDALLELKKEFPEDINNMKVFSEESAKEYYDVYKIKNRPAIIVVYNDKVVAKINGEASKEQIIKPVAQALSEGLEK